MATKKSSQEIQERRAKRAERRLKQRVENSIRAKEMHKARLLYEKTTAVKKEKSRKTVKTQSQYHIGCSGWYYWHWKETFYPNTLKCSQWFDYYTKNFGTVELNAPFYSWPTLTSIRNWIKQTKGQPMVYTVKVCELITHIKRFAGTKTLIKDFYFIGDLLGEHMGCFLFQFPPSFHYTPELLKTIAAQLDPKWRNVVEFRHASWWNENVFKTFRKAGIIFCSCSGPKLPEELIKTADDIYIRLHGTSKWYSHNYNPAELKAWAKRIQISKARKVWAYFNNDRNAFAIKNAHQLMAILNTKKTK